MTISMDQRKTLAEQMRHTIAQLEGYDKSIQLRDLPDPLQKEIRAYQLIGPLTSSGLEYVYNVINRLAVAIFALPDPLFAIEDNRFKRTDILTSHNTVSSSAETDTKPITQPAPTPSKNNELDFGPFDPRKAQR